VGAEAVLKAAQFNAVMAVSVAVELALTTLIQQLVVEAH
jgi:hypothetical protein